MAPGISGSDAWRDSLAQAVAGLELVPALDAVAALLNRKLGLRVWFVRINGPRWSHVAGGMSEHPVTSPLARVELPGGMGLVSDNWDLLDPASRQDLLAFVSGLIGKAGPA